MHVRLMIGEEALKQWAALEQPARDVAAAWASDSNGLAYRARARIAQNNAAGAKQAYARVLERIPPHAEAQAFLERTHAQPWRP